MIITNKKLSENQIFNYLKEVDTYFPVHLSARTDLHEYAQKLHENATLYYEMEDDKIIALLGGYTQNIRNNMGFITLVVVDPEHRSKGHAKDLMHRFMRECYQLGFDALHLYTSIFNKPAINLYKALGFLPSNVETEENNEEIHFVYQF